jgi:hypothetical protein
LIYVHAQRNTWVVEDQIHWGTKAMLNKKVPGDLMLYIHLLALKSISSREL